MSRPPATPAANLSLSLEIASSGCASTKPATCVACLALRLDRWPTSPARIDVLSSARPVANLRLSSALRASVRPAANPPTFVGVLPPARPRTNFRFTPDLDPSARLVSNHSAFASDCCNLQLALSAAAVPDLRQYRPSAKPVVNFRLASAVPPPASPVSIHSACALWFYFRLGF